MKIISNRNILLISIVPVFVLGLFIIAQAQTPGPNQTPGPTLPASPQANNLTAQLSEIVGVVEANNGQQKPYNPVNNGFRLQSNMDLQTEVESRVRLDLSIGSIVRLGPSTTFSLGQQALATQEAGAQGLLSNIELQAGTLWIILQGRQVNVNTPAGLASVRGTYMSVSVDPVAHTITVTCLEGECGYTNAAGDVDMISGQKIVSSDLNVLPTLQTMDQSDLQTWLANSPESAAIVPQVSSILASATPLPSPTPTSAAGIPVTGLGTPTSTATLQTSASLILIPVSGPGAFSTSTPAPGKPKHTKPKRPLPTHTPQPTLTHPTPTATVEKKHKHHNDGDHDKDDDGHGKADLVSLPSAQSTKPAKHALDPTGQNLPIHEKRHQNEVARPGKKSGDKD